MTQRRNELPGETPALPPSVPLVQWWNKETFAWVNMAEDSPYWTDDLREWVKIWSKGPAGIEHRHTEVREGQNKGRLYRVVFSVTGDTEPATPVPEVPLCPPVVPRTSAEGPLPAGGLDDEAEPANLKAPAPHIIVEVWDAKAPGGPSYVRAPAGRFPDTIQSEIRRMENHGPGAQSAICVAGTHWRVTNTLPAPAKQEGDEIAARIADAATARHKLATGADAPTLLDQYALAIIPAIVAAVSSNPRYEDEGEANREVSRLTFNLALQMLNDRPAALERLKLLQGDTNRA